MKSSSKYICSSVASSNNVLVILCDDNVVCYGVIVKLAVFLGLPKEKRTPEAVADKYYEVLNDALKSGQERFNENFNILS